MARTQKAGRVATSVFKDTDGYTKVIYHQTPVVKFNAEEIILNSGGWLTVTTKTRMNQAANQYGLGFNVYQKNHKWFVDFQGLTVLFSDGLTFKRGE